MPSESEKKASDNRTESKNIMVINLRIYDFFSHLYVSFRYIDYYYEMQNE